MPTAAGRTSTRLRLIDAARELFWDKGYEATSLGDVVKRAKANPGSLYYFFKSKEDLLLAVLDRYTELLWPMVVEPAFKAVDDPMVRVFAVLEGYRQGLMRTDFARGCPIGSLALEIGEASPKAREKIAANFDGWIGWIRKCLDDAADQLPPETDRRALARFVLTVMEGAVMQARAYHSLEPFDAAVKMLGDYLARLTTEAEARK
jgi:TetR/AcrR family transcriptional regulator, transcriptional repressor for nem operon